MPLKLSSEKIELVFKKAAGTSRGILNKKYSWIIYLHDVESQRTGTGECSILPNLSLDNPYLIENKLNEISNSLDETDINVLLERLEKFPALRFGIETAYIDLKQGGKKLLFDNDFSKGKKGILINGLIWMNGIEEMWKQVEQKVAEGFHTIKLKIGALDFSQELQLLERIRNKFGFDLELRLDANGAFVAEQAEDKLMQLSKFRIHSMEQPIAPQQYDYMKMLCLNSPIPIALDEELIGIHLRTEKQQILEYVRPQFLIIKPSLIGGLKMSDEWIELAEENNIGWWATSALESNIGLNAIAQWTAEKNTKLPQGLGTGSLFENNIELPLKVIGEELFLFLS